MDRLEEIKKKIKLFGTSPVAKRSIKYFDYKDSDWLISEIERLRKAGNKQNDEVYKLSCDVIIKDEAIEWSKETLKNMTTDYLREKNEKDVLVKVLDKIKNAEGDVEYLRKIAGKAIGKELDQGGGM